MLHIYRQITSLRRVRPFVIAQKRENSERFPFECLVLVRKPRTHFVRRFYQRQLRDAPWQISKAETMELMRLLGFRRAKLLHIYFGHIAVHLLPLIKSWSRPCIVSFHGADAGVDLQKAAYRSATSEMLHAVSRVLVRSQSLRRALIEMGCDGQKIEVQRTGIPLREFPFHKPNAPANGEWRLLQAGRLIEKKGFETALRGFALFRREFPKSTMTIAGEGPLLLKLHELARQLNIANAVRFAGFVSQNELRELFYSSHIFLHPSQTGGDGNQEGIPNSMLEAMATGLPVFATEHGGIPEAIENERTGILVRERDYESLAGKLIDAVRSPQQLFALGGNGSESVRHNFDQDEQTARLENIYLREMESAAL
jgi:colanic acid/amylovoran biosynthesis glycosyltransferase